jgi:hypothetical protein
MAKATSRKQASSSVDDRRLKVGKAEAVRRLGGG